MTRLPWLHCQWAVRTDTAVGSRMSEMFTLSDPLHVSQYPKVINYFANNQIQK